MRKWSDKKFYTAKCLDNKFVVQVHSSTHSTKQTNDDDDDDECPRMVEAQNLKDHNKNHWNTI
jgi:hypothetical protein